jgi:phage repressor protein C with HTH and peptisase S24 domain
MEDLITLEYKDVFDNNEDKKIEFSSTLLKEPYNIGSLFALKVDGESMQPVIKNRSIVIADLSQKEITDESIYLIYHDNKMWVKKAKKDDTGTSFVSINREYSHLVYKQNEVHLVAKVILTFTNL